MKEKLTIALLINDYQMPQWICNSLNEIFENNYAQIKYVIKEQTTQNKHSLLHKLYNKLDNKIFKSNPNGLKSISIKNEEWFKNAIVHEDENEAQGEEVLKEKVDIIFLFGENEQISKYTSLAKYGVWCYKISSLNNNENPDGFWEVMDKIDVTKIFLCQYSKGQDLPNVIQSSSSSTNKRSVGKNINRTVLKASSFLPHYIKGLCEYGEEWLSATIKRNTEINENQLKSKGYPSNLKMIALAFSLLGFLLSEIIQKIRYKKQWILLCKFGDINPLSLNNFKDYIKLIPPKDKFWADPFVVKKDEKYYIFLEELEFKNYRGYLSVMEINEKGECTKPQIILEEKYHMSYPFVFEYDNGFYMIPETKENKTIDLYKCTNFPYKWEFFKTIMKDISAVDTTVYFKNNKWWLFTNIQRNRGASVHDELFIFYADDLLSDNWISHIGNPVISDVRKARPAGKLFVSKGELYRPSQDCSKRYGYALKINKITSLEETNYQEEVVNEILPNWEKKLLATHTFNHDEGLTVLDAQYLQKRF